MILLEDLLDGAAGEGAQVLGEVRSREFQGFAYDSRNVQGGEMFVAVRTERADGHDFIADACRCGAAGVLLERRPASAGRLEAGVTCVAVRDTRAALRAWAGYVLRRQAPLVIGVTGSVGKTGTAKAVATLLRHLQGDPRAVFDNDNFNDLFGLPISLGRLAPAHQTAVLELASDSAGEIAALCRLVAPQWGVITNVAPAHLQHFETLERLAGEYGCLAEAVSERLILHADDPLVAGMAGRIGRHGGALPEVITYGLGGGADVRATDVRSDPGAAGEVGRWTLAFRLHWRGAVAGVRLRLVGRHNVATALAAAGAALSQGLDLQEVAAALSALEPMPGRLRPRDGRGGRALQDDTDSASDPSPLAAVDGLGDCPPPPVCVMGAVSARRRRGVPADRARRGRRSRPPGGRGRRPGRGGARAPGRPAAAGAPGCVAHRGGHGGLRHDSHGIQLWAPWPVNRPHVLVKGAEGARLERVVEGLLDRPEAQTGSPCARPLGQSRSSPCIKTGRRGWRLTWGLLPATSRAAGDRLPGGR